MTGLSLLDWTVLSVYLAVMLGIGFAVTGRQRSTREYFTASQQIHWLPVALSVIATLFSGIAFVGHPARVYRDDAAMIAYPFSLLLATPVVVYVLLPFYRRLRVTTAYEYLEQRFGLNVRLLGSALFLGKRLLWMSLVAVAPSLALSSVTGLSVVTSILIIGVVSTIYTGMGGARAVIWTDAVQFVIFMVGQCLIIGLVAWRIDGGIPELCRVGFADHKAWASLDFDLARLTFWTALIACFFLSLSDLGADQVTVQRLISTKDEKTAARAMWFNAILKFPSMIILLGMGVALWAFYKQYPERLGLDPANYDKLVPYFVVHELPPGISGLVIAAIFAAAMSSFSGGLNAMVTAYTVDWHERLGKGSSDDCQALRLAKWLTYILGGAITLTGIWIYLIGIQSIIDSSNKYLGFFGGALLGIFLLGALTRRAKALPTVLGGLLGVSVVLALDAVRAVYHQTYVHEYLYSGMSCLLTMLFGYFGSFFGPPLASEQLQGLTVSTMGSFDEH
jgi:solute:Na+ symporter, SSS family